MESTKTAIVCLGKNFVSEDERREYFREELRKKLPKLKGIEGFPIGEDEDIVNLSDPPYYTACPNPWLNDFIEEWENEKIKLYHRSQDFFIDEPYASDVSEGKNNPVYTAHTYHTKVPHSAIMRYLLHYTLPGDTVLDAFAGTGMTGVAAQILENPDQELKLKIDSEWRSTYGSLPTWGKRKAICLDLSPYASFISYYYNSATNVESFDSETRKVLENVTKDCNWLYETKHSDGGPGLINYTVWSDVFICSNCNNEIIFWEAALDKEAKSVLDVFSCKHCNSTNSKEKSERSFLTYFDDAIKQVIKIGKIVPVLIVYTYKGKRYQKDPDKFDLELVSRINDHPIPKWFPNYRMPKGDEARRNDKAGITHVHHFYTKRNLFALSILNHHIETSNLPLKLKFILTGMINRSTLMNRIHVKNFFYGGGGWNGGMLKGTLYIPSISIETSILEQISDKIESFKKAIKYLNESYSNVISVGSATSISMENNTIDYIFTDPPFGANIMYSELNALPESWLKILTNNSKEAIENKSQGKSILDYQNLMTQSFSEYYRVLKPGKWMTVEFSNTSAAVWNGIQTAIQKVGFIIANVAALDKKQGSFNAVTNPTSVKQDLVISCYKPTKKFEINFRNDSTEVSVWEFIKEHLHHLPIHIKKANSTTAIIERSPKILFDRLISFYFLHGFAIPIDAKEFQEGLKQRFIERDGMFFTSEQVLIYDEKKQMHPHFVQLSLLVSTESEGVEWLRLQLKKSQTYQDLHPKWLQAIAAIRKGDILPELKDILNENFILDNDGKWRVPNLNESKDREILRNKKLQNEFQGYVQLINIPKAKKLKEVRVEALRVGFKNSWEKKDFETIVKVGDMIPQNILLEDEKLLMYYDIAKDRV